MSKIIIICTTCMLLFGAAINVKADINVTQFLTTMKSEITAKKKSMLEDYPFGSINNINATTVNRAEQKLGNGSMADMITASSIHIEFTQCRIMEWYINAINTLAPTPSAKSALAKEYTMMAELIENTAEILGVYASFSNFGGSLASLSYCGVKSDVYDAWLKAVQQKPRPRDKASKDNAATWLNQIAEGVYDKVSNLAEDIEDEDDLARLKDQYKNLAEPFGKITDCASKGYLSQWVIDSTSEIIEQIQNYEY